LAGVLEIAVNAPGPWVSQYGGLIIKPRNPSNHRPKFQTKFGVAKEEPDRPKLGSPTGPMSIPLPLKYPTPGAFPMGVSLKQEKPPHLRGLLSSN